MESLGNIPTILFVVVTILVILILIAFIVFIVSLLKVLNDIRKLAENINQIGNTLREKPLLELFKDEQFKNTLFVSLKENFIRILPFFAGFIAFLITRKKKGKRKSK